MSESNLEELKRRHAEELAAAESEIVPTAEHPQPVQVEQSEALEEPVAVVPQEVPKEVKPDAAQPHLENSDKAFIEALVGDIVKNGEEPYSKLENKEPHDVLAGLLKNVSEDQE
jgi:hypothetical protein